MNITVYPTSRYPDSIDRFLDALLDADLTFYASELRDIGLGDDEDIRQAVERAVQICNASAISVRKNFKCVYRWDRERHTVTCDWRLSPMARKLVIMNGNASNPLVAKVQLTLLER